MLRNIVGPVLTYKIVFVLVVFCLFLKNPLLSSGRMRFSKTKKTKKMDLYLTYKKAKIGPAFNSTAYIYIYIYI